MKLYLDIETTGLSASSNDLTVLGALKEDAVIQLVANQNLTSKAVNELFSGVTEIVSFNGIRFDVPFIQKCYPTLRIPASHKDLMYLGWQVGLKGGLKKIEAQFGLVRSSGVKNGFEAVRLWQKHLKGDDKSLKRLLKYNREDVCHLPIVEKKLDGLKSQFGKTTENN